MPRLPDPLPLALYRAEQVRQLDAGLIAAGTPGFMLMQLAAQAAWRALRRYWPQARHITVLTGRGNNAGDGFLLATLAQQAGWAVQVWTVGASETLQDDAARAYFSAQQCGVAIAPYAEQPLQGVVVDALLGTGLRGEVRAPYAAAIQRINASGLPVLAIDIPSGLCADTGSIQGEAVRADLTVTFVALKVGLFLRDGPDVVGALAFSPLRESDATQIPIAAQRLAGDTLPVLPVRRRNCQKGDFGRVLVVGGDSGFGGAVLLAAESALRSGAGLVSVATRAEHVAPMLARRPEIMVHGVRSANEVHALAPSSTVLVVGMGLGQSAWSRSLLGGLAQYAIPQVWDADALNLLASGQVVAPSSPWIVTPHPGEAARLLRCSVAEVQTDRLAAAHRLAQQLNAVVVLKGAGSVIATPQAEAYVCTQGHPAMAGAGFGDVLAGLLGALLAQGLSPAEAARLGVWLHARAGEKVGLEGRGMAAADVLPVIRQLLEEHAPCQKP